MANCSPVRKQIHDRDTFHAFMAKGVRFGDWDMPVIEPEQRVPTKLVPFSVAVSKSHKSREGFVHFCEDDGDFERFWKNPRKYLSRLLEFDGAISPDFSTCSDMPIPLSIWNTYRNKLCGAWLQRQGMHVIPLVRMVEHIAPMTLAGIPRHAPVAVCARGNVSNPEKRALFVRTLKCAIDELRPTRIIWYGSDAHGTGDYPRSHGIPVITYPARGRGDMGGDADER